MNIATDQVQRTVAQTATKWGIGLFVAVAGLAAIVAFWPQITDAVDFQRTVEENRVGIESANARLDERGPIILGLQRTTENLQADLNRIFDRVAVVEDEEGGLVNETRSALTDFTGRLAIAEDNVGDLQGQVNRVEAATELNTEWRDDQEKRAATRVAEQGFREMRLDELEQIVREIEIKTLPELKQAIALLQANTGE